MKWNRMSMLDTIAKLSCVIYMNIWKILQNQSGDWITEEKSHVSVPLRVDISYVKVYRIFKSALLWRGAKVARFGMVEDNFGIL